MPCRTQTRTLVAAVALLFVLTGRGAWAIEGGVDLTFGGGAVTTDFVGQTDQAYGLAIQADGKLVAVGLAAEAVNNGFDFALARYNSDGSLDDNFGNHGKVLTAFNAGNAQANAIVIQPDGKLVVAGWVFGSNAFDFALARYNSDGTPDPTFGNNSQVTTNFGANSTDQAFALALQGDGKLVVVGSADLGASNNFALARYNSNGSLDTNFGSGGMVTTDVDGTSAGDIAHAVAIQTDGKLVVVGQSNSQFGVVRYNSDGSLDNNFGSGGKVLTPFNGTGYANAVAVLSSGKILVAGEGNNDFALARYNSNGSVDTTFGSLATPGHVTTDFNGGFDQPNAMQLQVDGKILLAGYASSSGNPGSHHDFAIVRYNPDGSLDTTFNGTGGNTDSFNNADNEATAMVIQADKQIVLAGFAVGSTNGSQDFALCRFIGYEPPTLTLGIAPTFFSEGAGANAATGTVTRSNTDTSVDLIVSLSSSNTGKATVPVTVTIPAGSVQATFPIAAVDNALADGDQGVTISAGANGFVTGAQLVTVTDNDVAALTLGLDTNTVVEGGTLTATLTRNTPPGAALTVALATSDATAATVPANVTIPAGSLSTAFTINATDDFVADGPQTATITATAGGFPAVGVSVTVNDNDTAGITVTPTAGLVTTEAGGAALFSVVLTSQPVADVRINLSSSNIGEGTVSPSALIFAAANWNVPQSVTVTGVDDGIADGDQRYTVTLAAALSTDPNYSGRKPTDVSLTNKDIETPTLTLSLGASSVIEGGTVIATITRNTPVTADLGVALGSSDSSAATVPSSVTIPAGAASANFLVSATDDGVVSGPRSAIITATAAGFAPVTATLTVTDKVTTPTPTPVPTPLPTPTPMPGPPNDNFGAAQKLEGDSGSVSGTNVDATREPGEPNHAGNSGGHSVWYSWSQFSFNGPVTVDTSGSSFDTLLAVYTGSSVRALAAVASNDDAAFDRTSSVTFTMTAGTNYYIAVDGANGATGNIKLNWQRAAIPSATIRWTRSSSGAIASGNWNNAANWTDTSTNQHRVPLPRDYIAIDRPGVYTVTLDVNPTIAGIAGLGAGSGRQTLLFNGHALTTVGIGLIKIGGDLNLDNGNFINTGELTVDGQFDWAGGRYSGDGNTTIGTLGHLNIFGDAQKFFSQQRIANAGTIQWSGAGGIRAGSGAAIVNNKTFNVQTDATFDWDGIAPLPRVTNVSGGTFAKSSVIVRRHGVTTRAGIGMTAFNGVAFSNLAGVVNAQSGSIRLNGGGESYGRFNSAAGSGIEFTRDYLFDRQLSAFSGDGTTRVNGGHFTVDDPRNAVTVNVQNFELTSGALAGSDTLNIGAAPTGTRATTSATFVWSGGSMSGTGQTNIGSGAVLAIQGSAAKAVQQRVVNNYGTVQWNAAAAVGAGGGAVINNFGTFKGRGGASFTYSGTGPRLVFHNSGRFSPGILTTPAAAVQGRTLTGSSGIFTLTGDFAQTTTGALNIQIGGALSGQFDQLNVAGNAALNGALNVSLANGFRPAVGSRFKVLGYTAHSGTFANVTGQNLGNGLFLVPQTLSNGVYLVAVKDLALPTVAFTTPTANAIVASLGTVRGTTTDAVGDSGIDHVDLFIQRRSDSKYWTGTAWSATLSKLTTTLSSSTWLRVQSTTTGMPGGANLLNGSYNLRADAYDKVGKKASSSIVVTVKLASEVAVSTVSAVSLSQTSASVAGSSIQLRFSGDLDAESAADAAHYAVTVNGHVVTVESAAYDGQTHTVTLALSEGSLHAGDAVMVTWRGVLDTNGAAVARTAGPLAAR